MKKPKLDNRAPLRDKKLHTNPAALYEEAMS